MLTNYEPDDNIDDLTDSEMYVAIRYLEPCKEDAKEMDEGDRKKDNGVVICIFLYVALLVCLGFVWFYWR
jgi:hypothetical protein